MTTAPLAPTLGADRPTPPETAVIQRPGGGIAYDVQGSGPLVVCLPGMGATRGLFRFLAPALAAAGYRVATMDLRGHGESDTSFHEYDDIAAGGDALALIDLIGGDQAVLIGNSMGAGASVWAAAEAPDRVAGLILLGPFVRDHPAGGLATLATRLALMRPWGPAVWRAYHARLYPSRKPADFAEYQTSLSRSLGRPGAWRAFVATTKTRHAPVEARLGEVRAPALVVMGERDSDFPDPAAEASWIADRLHAETLLVPGAGHYPQVERPDLVVPAITGFLDRVIRHA